MSDPNERGLSLGYCLKVLAFVAIVGGLWGVLEALAGVAQ